MKADCLSAYRVLIEREHHPLSTSQPINPLTFPPSVLALPTTQIGETHISPNRLDTVPYSPAKSLPASKTTHHPLSAKTTTLLGVQTFKGRFLLKRRICVCFYTCWSLLRASGGGADVETREGGGRPYSRSHKLGMERSAVVNQAHTWIRS
jgi:hypothetical protein